MAPKYMICKMFAYIYQLEQLYFHWILGVVDATVSNQTFITSLLLLNDSGLSSWTLWQDALSSTITELGGRLGISFHSSHLMQRKCIKKWDSNKMPVSQ
jgi:hypothetical protein